MQELQISPLQLEGYYVKELQCLIDPELEATAKLHMLPGLHFQVESLFQPEPFIVNIKAAAGPSVEDPLRWKTFLTIESDTNPGQRFPYKFAVVFVGYFRVSSQYPAEHREALVKAGSISILYSAARELIATVTGRGPFPAAVLPTISLIPSQNSTSSELELSDMESKKAPSKDKRRKKTSSKKGK